MKTITIKMPVKDTEGLQKVADTFNTDVDMKAVTVTDSEMIVTLPDDNDTDEHIMKTGILLGLIMSNIKLKKQN